MDSLLNDKPPPYMPLHESPSPSSSGLLSPAPTAPEKYATTGNVYPQQPMVQQPAVTAVIAVQPPPAIVHDQPQVVVINNNNGGRVGGRARCAACNYGQLKNHYSCCAILLCIFCPGCGCVCCLCMRNKKCNHCGIEF